MRQGTEKEIARRLKAWANLRERKGRIEAERDERLEPLRQKFEQRCAPIVSAASEKLEPLQQQMAELEREITDVFIKAISEPNKISFRRIDTATAIAEVITRQERELDPKVFFDSVPPSKRDSAFWSCLKTLIGAAEKFLGRTRLDEICHTKQRHTVQVRAKEAVCSKA